MTRPVAQTSAYGKLFGVGVGPGAPDLMTLRAVNVLRQADVLAIPRASAYSASTAWKIAGPNVGEVPGQERIFLTFPMSMDPGRVVPAWQKAFEAIGEHLEAGRSVAFLAEGDPMLFSTFVYLLDEAPRRWPGIEIEVVPGVSSITAVPAMAGIPLADGQERIAILPGAYGVEDLERVLESFDTVVLMKIGANMPEIIATLERKGLAGRTVYVNRATMPGQKIVREIGTLREASSGCFSMMIVNRRERSGVLLGKSEPGARLGKVPGPEAELKAAPPGKGEPAEGQPNGGQP